MAVYTGLRCCEITQWTCLTLRQLNNREQYVSIMRKNTAHFKNGESEFWRPVYNTHLTMFVNNLTNLYNDEYDEFIENYINLSLFDVKEDALIDRIRTAYSLANHSTFWLWNTFVSKCAGSHNVRMWR